MTNSIAVGLFLAIVAFLALDGLVLHQDYALRLARTLVVFIEWVSFWR